MKHVGVIGAGFGGLRTALRLSHLGFKVELFDRSEFHLVTPELYGVLQAEDKSRCRIPLSKLLAGTKIRFRQLEINRVDVKNKSLETGSGQKFSFDYLVIACGLRARASGFGFHSFESAQKTTEALRRLNPKEVIVVGGGTSGVEIASAIRDVISGNDPKRDPVIKIYEEREFFIPFLDERQLLEVKMMLQRSRIHVLEKAHVVSSGPEEIILDNNQSVKTGLVIEALGRHGLPFDIADVSIGSRGGLQVDDFLKVADNVWAIGDVAEFSQYSAWRFTAQSALRESDHVVDQIAQKTKKAFVPNGVGYFVRMPSFEAVGILQSPWSKRFYVSGKSAYAMKLASHFRYRWDTWRLARGEGL